MRKCFILIVFLTLALVMGCGGQKKMHTGAMPDPAGYDAHFGDIDTSGDDFVKWYEFKKYFPKSEPRVFMTIDMNNDAMIDHDEWHNFKAAHGMKHHD